MGMTMTQKILAAHAGLPSVCAGQLIEADLDLVLGNDITSPVAIHEMDKMKVDGVFDKDKIALVLDHFVPNKDIKSAQHCKCVREFACRHDIMKVLLMCANGLSTGILMNKMNQWAKQNNEDLEVKAIPIDDYLSVYKDYDVLLVGPQMRYKIKDVQKAVTDRPSAVINPSDYALGNVENIIKEIKRMIKEEK